MEKPFEHIALSLGALKLLAEADLLKNVHMLSTISGGTITGAYYAVNAKKKKTFAEIYRELYGILEKDEIVNIALDVLEKKEVDVPSGRQNIILSFAEAYDRELFHKEKFGIFRKGKKENCVDEKEFHLKEIIFNATDFESGIAFRFRKSMGRSRIGNRNHDACNGRFGHLVASGRFTLCFNLLKYTRDLRKDSPLSADVKDVEKGLKRVWKKIKKDPYYDIEN